MRIRSGRHYASLFAFIAASFAVPLPALADPPPWAPAHGYRAKQERAYRYVYYPAQQVYFSPEQNIWFWMSGGNWQFGVNLPAHYRVVSTSGVAVTLASERPYRQHMYVEEQYGRPWREKHGHHGHKEDRHKEKHKEKHHKHHDRD
ncbi:MAG TPA: hypothetical protein VEC35_06370 [Noviherbaspirillum sp.]|nr:hypothetical protein [Noviherbaspirillum sp.]